MRQDRCRILPELRREAYDAYEEYEDELRRRGLWDDAGRSFTRAFTPASHLIFGHFLALRGLWDDVGRI